MRLGVLDIGSNTVHLLLVDAHPGAQPVAYGSHKKPLSLIQHLDGAGAVTERGQTELIGFVREARDFARLHRAEDLLAFCTSALRDAANGPAILDRIEAETGVRLQVLSGPQEAAATFQAVRSWYGWSVGKILNLDIGGGSFEMAMGDDALPAAAESVPLGASRLTRSHLPGDPPRPRAVREAREHVASLIEPVARRFEVLGRADLVAGTSKTFRSLARITGAAPSSAGLYARRELRREDLRLWTRRIEAMPIEERAELPGVSEVRAPQLLAGALVALGAMDAFGIESMLICPWALREGIILRRFEALMMESDEPLAYVGVGHVAF
ncbi:Ppx/GppA family phosphatase [Falsarthrobacter nasiphocae]|uniref:Exopolyphosphatase/guanosine-5'-triphosphate, 3'-diphosphate pyrophosphatase n=1 Tax=Falsarthrobacter nasiphocae TaxID=189863 RepID=A0AAE3YFB8_9MICC|nr:Ppx/GppA family phosphatase [Falsarthrobacter nasiphocae]MDR6892364.1 exopolyphosphatase/guanosine-5'-triphosphate,3'-diphosphate pyrophosphatase [Falsarthrobacter nasiphocae]